jgi:hypothetical protein
MSAFRERMLLHVLAAGIGTQETVIVGAAAVLDPRAVLDALRELSRLSRPYPYVMGLT